MQNFMDLPDKKLYFLGNSDNNNLLNFFSVRTK